MSAILVTIMISAAGGLADAPDDAALQRELKSDVLLRAVVDELERGRTGLKLEDLDRPYFLEYAILDARRGYVSATLGSVTTRSDFRSRRLRASVRVGSYELDNTNFRGDAGGFFGRGGRGSVIPIEDDYLALRQAIWWATDRSYKSAVEALEQKKAFMETKIIEEKPSDFSKEPISVHFDPKLEPTVPLAPMEALARRLSAVFLDYPDVQKSTVRVEAGVGNKYIVNSEGTRLREPTQWYTFTVSATAQADDGMELSDAIDGCGASLEDLGTVDQLQKQCRTLAQQLIRLRNAPILDSYAGPVVFDAEPAAELFAERFARRFQGGQRAVGRRSRAGDFEKKLNKRILPRSVSVVDDPSQTTIDGVRCMGHYVYDDEGVKAQSVQLVEGGKLKALVMSRNPSREFAASTGHGRGLDRPRASIGCVRVTASNGLDRAALQAELLEACLDEDLEFGIRIAALGTVGSGGGGGRRAARLMRRSGFVPSGSGSAPLAIYKVHPDGREELARGAEITRLDLDAFKRILAVGDKPYVYNGGSGTKWYTVAAPAMLFDELDLTRMDEDFDKPPILPNPLVRGAPPPTPGHGDAKRTPDAVQ